MLNGYFTLFVRQEFARVLPEWYALAYMPRGYSKRATPVHGDFGRMLMMGGEL